MPNRVREKKQPSKTYSYFSLIELAHRITKLEAGGQPTEMQPLTRALLEEFSSFKKTSHCGFFATEIGPIEEVEEELSPRTVVHFPSTQTPWTIEQIGTLAIKIPVGNLSLQKLTKLFHSMVLDMVKASFNHNYYFPFMAEALKDIIYKHEVIESRPVREVVRERGPESIEENSSYGTNHNVFDLICKKPNSAELSEIMTKFPPIIVERMEDLPVDEYPLIAIGECIVRYPYEGEIILPSFSYNYRWTSKSDKTKTKRKGEPTCLRRDKTKEKQKTIDHFYPNKNPRVHRWKDEIPKL